MVNGLTARAAFGLNRAFRDGTLVGMSDQQILERFVDRDEAAFEAILLRHGPMVRSVCRQLLDHHDVDDAFQVVFLVLVRKAKSPSGSTSLWGRGCLGSPARAPPGLGANRRKQWARESSARSIGEELSYFCLGGMTSRFRKSFTTSWVGFPGAAF